MTRVPRYARPRLLYVPRTRLWWHPVPEAGLAGPFWVGRWLCPSGFLYLVAGQGPQRPWGAHAGERGWHTPPGPSGSSVSLGPTGPQEVSAPGQWSRWNWEAHSPAWGRQGDRKCPGSPARFLALGSLSGRPSDPGQSPCLGAGAQWDRAITHASWPSGDSQSSGGGKRGS